MGFLIKHDVHCGRLTVLSTKMIGYGLTESQKIVVDKLQNRVVEKDVVMNEKPENSIVVVAKRATYANNLQTAQR